MLSLHPEKAGLFLPCGDLNLGSQIRILHLRPPFGIVPFGELGPHTVYLRILTQKNKTYFLYHKVGHDVEKTHFSGRIHAPGTF